MYYSATMRLGQRTKQEKSQAGDTARRILEHARKSFNDRGVMAVGIREIARDLGLSPGNVSYHFPRREDLVAALMEDLHAQNNAQLAVLPAQLDLAMVDRLIRATMTRDLENRWLMLDTVSLLSAMPELRPRHEEMHRARVARVDAIAERLVAAGLLDRRRTQRGLELLRLQVVTQIFFWVPSAIAAAPDRDPAEALDLHARAALALVLPYCTETGEKQLERLLRR